MYLRVLEL